MSLTRAIRSVRASRLSSLSRRPAPSFLHGTNAVISDSRSFSTFPCFRSFPFLQAFSNVVPFLMADIGEGITEVEVLQWYVKEGDKISQFDRVCEVQSDKATVEITSRYDGVVSKLHYKKGDLAKVGKPLIDVQVEGAVSSEPSAFDSKPGSSAPASTAPGAGMQQQEEEVAAEKGKKGEIAGVGKALATPAVRRVAREKGIDLSSIRGSGPNGRVLVEDLESASSSSSSSSSPATAVESGNGALSSAFAASADVVIPVRGITRTMIKTMESSLSIPHLGYSDEIVMDKLISVRSQLKDACLERGVKITYMPFFIKACSLALSKYPILNSSLTGSTEGERVIVQKAAHNIGIAMDTPSGLLVPNIKNCESKSIFEIARELNDLQALAKAGKLSSAYLTGGSFSISNIGAIGGTYARPVIVPPEVGIGAIGKIQTLPRFDATGNIVKANILNISWSADHRIVDGATIAKFSNAVIGFIENPETLLVDLK
ncbi:mitochondrial branched-chain amino acid degradation dihydrolipoamide branched-chain transacylase E2 subunit [Andalucia godoyi]|uniref:Dihydrolipoamide acetyltransferase component of pyruvate dehydrogenase complex n=1 Tax=Andalucia godoyi TaxID=505711 RepID=A0A8K0AHM4_ANDGO|nr:mitochondrial branched-chain amino acid degradation dihydrolipoamide branched-chain transacylase E2 subunit [Andalucia godoyi]|eukprot:ANDGO_08307.mRNA.1 mitochondrial branched-chain amino acid degradation dihydrolipoamide branched-chain transacylase E2 subunit